jgi:hypothetical protein
MDHPEGAGSKRADRVEFDRRVHVEFRGAQLSSDDGLLVMRELDDALGLSDLAAKALRDNRRGKNTVHRLDGLFRQSVFGRLAGYEDVNDADRLALDPVMRQIVGGRAVYAQAASASQMGRFETETLALPENRTVLADLNGQWIDRFHDRNGLKFIVLDMDSSVKPNESGRTGLSAALKNTAAEAEHGGFAVRSAQCKPPARPTTPLGTENACPAGRFGRNSRQPARHLGNVDQHGYRLSLQIPKL